VIALLFALIAAALGTAMRGQKNLSLVLFTLSFVMSIYWFKFHATSALNVML